LAEKESKNKLEKKKLCKLCKNDCLKNGLKDYIKLVNEPSYICKKCGRAANKSKSLCRPEEI
jgi:hypothetical protein